MSEKCALSIVMPCLNEERTIGGCIDEAQSFLKRAKLAGEIIVVDNNSTDGSVAIAKEKGVRIVCEKERGYGNALRAGLRLTKGEVIIMGDGDLTYDFANLDEMYKALLKYDLVIGDRFKGDIEKGAMPWSHYVGVKGLSGIARVRYGSKVRDFHCGLRGVRKDALTKMKLKATGMEFATEMIAEATRKDLTIGQVPVELRKSVKGRRSKLNTIRDGFRHLYFILFK